MSVEEEAYLCAKLARGADGQYVALAVDHFALDVWMHRAHRLAPES